MADLKTKQNDKSVDEFIQKVENPQKQKDSKKILKILKEITGDEPKMWGSSIVGFGEYHYVYSTGREGDWMRVGFSPRKQTLTLYLMDGLMNHEEKLKNLGKHKTGKSCLYIKKLQDVDLNVLKEIINDSIENMNKSYPL